MIAGTWRRSRSWGRRRTRRPAPTLTSTVPASPANQNAPKLLGSAAPAPRSRSTRPPIAAARRSRPAPPPNWQRESRSRCPTTRAPPCAPPRPPRATPPPARRRSPTSRLGRAADPIGAHPAALTPAPPPPSNSQAKTLVAPASPRCSAASTPPKRAPGPPAPRRRATAASPTGPPLRSAGDRRAANTDASPAALRMADRHDAPDAVIDVRPHGHDQRLDPDLRIPLHRGRLELRLLDRHRHRELRTLLGPRRHPHPREPARRRHLHLPRPRDRSGREPRAPRRPAASRSTPRAPPPRP